MIIFLKQIVLNLNQHILSPESIPDFYSLGYGRFRRVPCETTDGGPSVSYRNLE